MQCCICLGDPVFALETNCGHVYCGEDFFEFFRRVDTGVLHRNLNSNIICDFIRLLRGKLSGILRAPSCPYCRQRVTVLLPFFTEEERGAAELDRLRVRNEVVDKVKEFNRRFSGEKNLCCYCHNFPVQYLDNIAQYIFLVSDRNTPHNEI